MQEQVADGESQGQVDTSTQSGNMGDVSPDQVNQEKYDKLEAKYDLLLDEFGELKTAIYQSQQSRQQAAVPDVDDDDDEPVTQSKVKKAVRQAVTDAVSQSKALNERQVWDDKARKDFNVTDPKFELELKKQWREMQVSGYDLTHPRALYEAAKRTALVTGITKKSKPVAKDADTEHTAEPPTNSQTARKADSVDKMIPMDDPRMRFFTSIKDNNDPKKIEAMRKKLARRESQPKRARG